MSYYITYSSLDQFIAGTPHSAAVHNAPHNRLLQNDKDLDDQLGSISSNVSSLNSQVADLQTQINSIPSGRVVTTVINQKSGTGSYPNISPSKGFTYTYTGSYVPLFIDVLVDLNGSSNATCRNQYRWLYSNGSPITSFVDYVGGNARSGGDGGAALNWQFNVQVPFIVGAKSIEFQDLHYDYRANWTVLTLTEHQISRWSAWGY